MTTRVRLYGREREVKYKTRVCLWSVAGWQDRVRVVLAKVDGFSQTFCVVSSATDLSALAILQAFCGRWQQEDGLRDIKQELGWEEARYWTENSVKNTTQMVLATMGMIRLLEEDMKATEKQCWEAPPWYKNKSRGSVRDVMKLFAQHREEINRHLDEFLGS